MASQRSARRQHKDQAARRNRRSLRQPLPRRSPPCRRLAWAAPHGPSLEHENLRDGGSKFAASDGSHPLALQAKIKLWQENFVALDLAPRIKPRQLGFSTRSSTPLTPVKRLGQVGTAGTGRQLK